MTPSNQHQELGGEGTGAQPTAGTPRAEHSDLGPAVSTDSSQHSSDFGIVRGALLSSPKFAQSQADALNRIEEQLEGTVSRDSALALIEDANRWGKAYRETRDELAGLKEQLEALRNFNEATRAAYAALYPARSPFPPPSDLTPGAVDYLTQREDGEWDASETAPLSAHFEYVDGEERRVWNPAKERLS